MKNTLMKMVFAALMVLSALSLFAGGRSESGRSEGQAPVRLRVFHFMSEQSKRDGLDKMIALYTAENPGVEVVVEATDFNNYTSTLKTMIAAGDAPDIIFGRPKMFAELVQAGQIMDISGASFLQAVSESSIESMVINGKVYGLPLDVQSMGVFYNMALFEEHGFSVPQTYSELITLCRAMEARGITPFAFGFRDAWTAQVVFQSDFYGGPLSRMPDFYEKTMDRSAKFTAYPELIASFERYARRLEYGNTDPFSYDYSRQLAMFAVGETAMLIQGSWAVGDVRKNNPDGRFGFFLNPTFNNARENLLNISVDDAFMASSQTKHKEEALQLLSVMVSPEGAKAWAETAKVISVVKGVQADALDPMLQAIQKYLDAGQTYNFEGGAIYSGQYDQTFRQIQEEFAADSNRDPRAYARRLDVEFDRIKATE
jgi:raffinose/stachyose/melibiose transport system substrate-binding protein